MSNYVKATNFATKDSLPTGDANKIVKGTEIDNEFNSIAGAVSSKADLASPSFTGIPTAPTAITGANTLQIATTAFVKTAVDNGLTAAGLGNMAQQNKTAVDITGGTITGTTVSGLASDLAVADGGTGVSTIAANAVVLGNGTSAVQTVAPSTSGNVLTSNGTTWISTAPFILNGGVVFTSSTTWTVPAGVTSVRVACVGGGGSGADYIFNGNAGTASSFGSYCTANGGGGGTIGNESGGGAGGAGGTATGGTLNISGNSGNPLIVTGAPDNTTFTAGAGGMVRGFVEGQDYYGSGGNGRSSVYAGGGGGGAGGYCMEYITGLTPGSTIAITVGAGGAQTTYGFAGGVQGIVAVQW